MTFDEYVFHIMSFELKDEREYAFLYKQLKLLHETKQGLAMKILIQQLINVKLLGPESAQ